MKKFAWLGIASLVVLALPEVSFAQPSRQLPGTRPYLPGSPPINQAPLNPRTRAAASATGLESTDFYGKKGYPKVVGDAVESQTTGGASGGSISASGGTLAGSASSGSISGSASGTSAGGISGSLTGGGTAIGGFGFGNASGSANPGITGGGFSGLVPKGFGFGGVPASEDSSLQWNRK